jgi:hypothetical protein
MPTVPDFAARAWQVSRDDDQIDLSILDGRGASMPAWRGRLSEAQVRELVALVRGFGPPGLPAPGGPAVEFARRFRELQAQWEELDQQIQALPRAGRGPAGPPPERAAAPGPAQR